MFLICFVTCERYCSWKRAPSPECWLHKYALMKIKTPFRPFLTWPRYQLGFCLVVLYRIVILIFDGPAERSKTNFNLHETVSILSRQTKHKNARRCELCVLVSAGPISGPPKAHLSDCVSLLVISPYFSLFFSSFLHSFEYWFVSPVLHS